MSMSSGSLSPFQIEKLEYYFDFFDSDGNKQLELSDLDGFMKKVSDYTGWEKTSAEYRECYEVHECFFQTLMEVAGRSSKSGMISLPQWLRMWEKLIPGCMTMSNFPIWVRLLPKSLYRIICKSGKEKISEKELSDFYVKFVGIPEGNVKSLVKYAMEQMTDDGHHPLSMGSYTQIFANFLIGKTPYGPGRFIFGCFEHMVQKTGFTLIQGPPDKLDDSITELKKMHISHQSPHASSPAVVKFKMFRSS